MWVQATRSILRRPLSHYPLCKGDTRYRLKIEKRQPSPPDKDFAEGVKTDPEKTNAVVDCPGPDTVHDLRNFLGLCAHYRHFVKNFSTIARPLHKLTVAKSNFNWIKECEKSFISLKQSLTSSLVLNYRRTDKDFILDTDASNEGIGAVLFQNIGDEEHIIAYFRKSLGKPETNYCVTCRELLAMYYLYDAGNFSMCQHGKISSQREDERHIINASCIA
ncbi:Retrovirus-related Pol polyprotein from transposon opus [Araneus ventricosus]|uniref:RNA-directed DNA polymerase n=1 Tax=Araneus ventricosus TaxID=182803 RepID=A0A4Y2DCX3_ARAVE|nr:Retrovirus-related Pol polyprotein from transposon opus [Araneus ventricosus]